MKSRPKVYQTGFADQLFAIECNNRDAYALAEFLFLDFSAPASGARTRRYAIISSAPEPMLSLWQGERRLYSGASRYQLAYTLMNEVIFHCINSHATHHALHAAAVLRGDRCILLPGKSGQGKSTITGWLISHGFHYLSDELVLLTGKGQTLPLTRPLNLKVNNPPESWLFPGGDKGGILSSEQGSMIPHRLLCPGFIARQPSVTDVIFPEYRPGAALAWEEISPAKSSLYLLESHVNARNLSGHGVSELAAIVKQCRSFQLRYSSFADLHTLFNTSSGLF
ncbi:hypothetical protein [Desulfogranum mediterraneum]|uniref:hypothetical protein n=1 Tax=Desulfogranum mediterraneum TaxID=160661 RepID=UPI000404A5A8|nr:hypothetical protein [Desulfogranum mediterraneum]